MKKFILITFLLMALTALSCFAGEPAVPVPPSGTDAAAADVTPETGLPSSSELPDVIIPATGHEKDILERWNRIKDAIKKKDYEAVRTGLDDIRGRCVDFGITSYEELSASMIKEGGKLLDTREVNAAMLLIDTAANISPNYPPAYFARGWAYFAQNKFKVLMTFDSFLEGFARSDDDFWWSFFYIGNKLTSLLFTFALLFSLFGLFMALRYIPLLAHDIAEMLSRIDAEDFIKYVALPGFFVLVLAALGYWWAATVVFIALWVYFNKWEKALAITFFVLLIFMPEVMTNLSNYVQAGGNRMLWIMDDTNKGRAPEGTEEYLKKLLKDTPDDETALVSLAQLLKKEGRYDESTALYERLAVLSPTSAIYRNNLGNIYFIKKDLDKAVKEYEAAVQYAPNMALPHFNLSQAYGEKLMFTERDQEDHKARDLDPNLVSDLREVTGNTPLRMVFDEQIPVSTFRQIAYAGRKNNTELADTLWSTSVKVMPLEGTRIAGIGFIILAFAVNALRKKGSCSHFCQKCGKVSCRGCQRPHYSKDLCAQCHQIFVRLEGVEAKDRLKKTIEVREIERRDGILYRVISLAIPGSGHFMKGRPMKGFVYAGAFVFFIKDIFFGQFYKVPYDFDIPFIAPDRIVMVVLLVVFYLIAQLDIHRITRYER